jgi:DNA-binding response OmpR family regulator
VLIVEDDRAARTAITKLLRRQGFAVSEAATVAEAMAGIAQAPPAWVLLDLMLPDGCGISVLQRVRAARLPCTVCIITGCDSQMLSEARRAGAEHTFTKPLDVERLMTLMCA